MKIFSNQKLIIAVVLLSLVSLSFVYYLPIVKKGYSFSINTNNLILARNLHLTGQNSVESQNNIILSSANIKDQGVPADTGNRLTSFIYAKIFDFVGFRPNLPLFVAIACFTLVNILFFVLILKRFNLLLATIFSLTLGFLPVFWQGALIGGFYEFALLFFTLGIFFYFFRDKINFIDLFIAGLFFGLAVAARNAFLISVIPFIIFEFFKNRSFKRIIIFSIPIILFFIILILPNNFYLNTSDSFTIYGHIFPDPYTYIFTKDDYINKMVESSQGEALGFLASYGYKPTLIQKLQIYLTSAPPFILYNSVRLVTFGGPLVIALFILGLVWSKYKFKDFHILFLIWLIVWFIGLTSREATNWDHFLEILFPIVLLVSFGIFWIKKVVEQVFTERRIKFFIFSVLAIAFLGHLLIADKWMFYEEYNTSNTEKTLVLVDKINNSEISSSDTIAFGGHDSSMYLINYYTDKNIVKFDQRTISTLLENGELEKVFSYFGVTHVIGYDSQLTADIVNETRVINIYN